MSNADRMVCTACGSGELLFGHVGTPGTPGNVFIPTGVFTLYGFKIRSYVCLDCGFIGQYLPKDKVARLKGRFGSGSGSSE